MRASITASLVAVIVTGCAGGRDNGARSSETHAARRWSSRPRGQATSPRGGRRGGRNGHCE